MFTHYTSLLKPVLTFFTLFGLSVGSLLPQTSPPNAYQAFVHFGVYGGLAFATCLFWPRQKWLLFALFLLSGLLEAAQYFVPGRTASWDDMAYNFAGVLAGSLLGWGVVRLFLRQHMR